MNRQPHTHLLLRQALLFSLLVFGIGRATAQDIEFELRAPISVGKGEQFRIEYIGGTTKVDLNDAEFGAPRMPEGLSVLSGPVSSVGVFMSNVNGVTQNRSTITYTYWLQAGTAAGRVTLPAATLTVGGRRYTTKAAALDVTDGPSGGSGGPGASGAARQQQPQGQQQGGGQMQPKATLGANDIILRMEVSKTDVYKGEPVVASLKIYTQVNIAGFENVKYPALNGFWAQELDVTGQGDTRSTIGGRVYHSQILRQWLLYPQRSGTLEIEQSQFTAVAQLVTQAPATGSPYDLFYGGAAQVRNVSAKLVSPVVKVHVRELPQPQPADFSGAVGQFELAGFISGDRFPANSAGSITVRLSGTGNFPLVEAPKIALPAAFEQFAMKTNERLTNTPRGTSGERTYEYPFIARAEGEYTIPSVGFSYFDPSTGRYNNIHTDEFRLQILRDEGGNGASGMGMVSGVTKEDLKMLGSDIRFIRMGDPRFVRQGEAFLWSAGWFVAVAGLVALFGGALFFLQKRIRERADIVRVKTKKANKVALRRLKRAKGYMGAGKEGPFFEEMLRALWGYMGDKLAIDVANLTKDRVVQVLVQERGVSEEQAREFVGLIGECEFAQYSPAAGVQMEKAYNAALDQLGRFESKI